jgi:hypothetical protein
MTHNAYGSTDYLARAQTYLAEATAGRAESYPTKAAQKAVADLCGRAYDYAQQAVSAACKPGVWVDLPYSLFQWRAKHREAALAVAPAATAALDLIDVAFALREDVMAAPIVKPAKAAGPDMTHPVFAAVAPMRAAAQDEAARLTREAIDAALAQLAAADWNMEAVAPYPSSRLNRYDYAQAKAKRAFLSSLVESSQRRDITGREWYVRASDALIARVIERAREDASFSIEAFAIKLAQKIGECVSASVVGHDVWRRSTLTVRKADGSIEQWRTQRILNVSVLGKLFNQWPTRRVA